MREQARESLRAIFQAALAAVDPEAAVGRHVSCAGDCLCVGGDEIDLVDIDRILVVGAGKASAFMARALEDLLGDRISDGWVNVKYGHGCDLRTVRVHEAGHPIPDQAGVEGSRHIADLLATTTTRDLVLCCLSGGGSALMPLPAEAVGLEEKQRVTGALLACGAPIQEVNAVRKHLSRIKGGQLARMALPARVATLILSDVIGDPLDVIASGPTAPDTSTFEDALAIVRKHGIEDEISTSALEYLVEGAAGAQPETPKAGDAVFDHVSNLIVANNAAAVYAASTRAGELGYDGRVMTTSLEGEARDVAAKQAALARETAGPVCLISGGETTVTLRGDGLGGRNQEFALAGALALAGAPNVTLLAAGTDGTDGPTDAAGAFADGKTLARAVALGLDAADFLARNDAYHFFDGLGDLLKTGPTGTNVMDLYLFLVDASDAEEATS